MSSNSYRSRTITAMITNLFIAFIAFLVFLKHIDAYREWQFWVSLFSTLLFASFSWISFRELRKN